MEIRARLRGQKNGFNMGIWLVSDESAGQKSYSEIDILENPVGPVTGTEHIRHSIPVLLQLIIKPKLLIYNQYD